MNTRCAAGLFYDSCALQIPGDVHFTPQGYEQMADVLGAQLFTR